MKSDGEDQDENGQDQDDQNKKSKEYFAKLLVGGSCQEAIQTTLWQDFCNTLALLAFKAIVEARKLDEGGAETRDDMVELVLGEWKKRSMGILSAQVNLYSEMRRTSIGRMLDEGMPDEETVKIRFLDAVRNVEKTARDMLTS